MSPFFANYGVHPRMEAEPTQPPNIMTLFALFLDLKPGHPQLPPTELVADVTDVTTIEQNLDEESDNAVIREDDKESNDAAIEEDDDEESLVATAHGAPLYPYSRHSILQEDA